MPDPPGVASQAIVKSHRHHPPTVVGYGLRRFVRELYHVLYWTGRTYLRKGAESLQGKTFDESLVPNVEPVTTPASVQELEALKAQRDAAAEARKEIESELEAVRGRLAAIKAENEGVHETHDWNEDKTRTLIIDLDLERAGWPLDREQDREYEVTGMCLGAQLAISVNNCPPPRDPRSRMTSFKRTQRKYVQKAYRVRNWREYETGLRARGSLTVWLGLTDGKLANWNSPRPTRRKPGRQRQYSNHAIETTVTLGLVLGLASRQTEGFLRSLLTLLNLDNDVPDHSTISRRKARLGKVVSYERRTVKPVHLLIDSSGLSVHVGQLRTPPKARDYRKLHLAVDEQTSDVVACELTSKRARDASRVASLVGQIERPIASAKADAAYDTGDVYKTLENHRAHRAPKVLIPPRKGAQLALDSAGTRQRNRNIRARSRVGKRKWYVASGYSRRSKVETTFHRYKAILGSAMRARGLASQRVEVRLGCKILNTMTALGIPDGEMIG